MNPVLFLDFDGVLHPDPCKKEELFASLPLVTEVLKSYPSVEIVISSAWRTFHSIDELRTSMGQALGPRIVGVTPELRRLNRLPDGQFTSDLVPGVPPPPRYIRQAECEAWLREHRPTAEWVAIDDYHWWFEPGCFNLLLTDQSMGFVPEQADILRHMIQERLG